MTDFLLSDDVRNQPIPVRIALVDQARQLFGTDFAKGLWISLGLPTIGRAATTQRRTLLGEQVDRFIAECLDPDPLSEVQAGLVFSVYMDWCRGAQLSPMKHHAFGRLMKQAGVASRQSNLTIYCGVRLKVDRTKNPDPLLDFGLPILSVAGPSDSV